jgi:hypothetical protein
MQALSTVLSPGQMGVRPTAAARGGIEEAEVRERRERIVVDVKGNLYQGREDDFWVYILMALSSISMNTNTITATLVHLQRLYQPL